MIRLLFAIFLTTGVFLIWITFSALFTFVLGINFFRLMENGVEECEEIFNFITGEGE